MPAHKFRYLLLFLIFALILGIYLARLQLAELAVSSSMRASGLKNVTTNISQLGLSQSKISHLEFSLLTETGLLQLTIQDAIINYGHGQLAEGRLDSIIINNLTLRYEKSAKTQDELVIANGAHETLQALKIIELLRHALREHIIVNTLSIQQITLNGQVFGALQGKSLALKSTAENKTVYAEISLLPSSPAELSVVLPQLVINRLSADSLTVELRHTETLGTIPAIVAAGLELNIQNTKLTGNYHINPQRLERWLRPFTKINDIREIKKVKGTFALNFGPDKQITSHFTAAFDKLVYKTYKADKLIFNLKLNNAGDNTFQHIQIEKGSYIRANNLNYRSFSLADSQINISAELTEASGNWLYQGAFASERLTANYELKSLQLKDITAQITAEAENLKINGNFSSATLPAQFSFALDHDSGKNRGKLAIRSIKALDLDTGDNRLSQLFTPWPYPYDLLSGKLKLASDATWSQKNNFSMTASIKLDDAGGTVGKVLFSGLSFDHELEVRPKLQSVRSSKINLLHIDSGVTASNISTNFELNTANTDQLPRFIIHGLQGEIFGGTFSAENFVFDPNSNKNSINIKATNIDLAEIVKTQQLEDITATGRIDGFIPVEIKEDGIFIKDGAFINDVHNGTIRYKPTAGTHQLKQNPVTGIALDALKDFRYSHLSAGVNYIPEGRLTINIQLKGISPELDTSRPVHLNINTEQNLLSLLKSLRYAQGINESINNKVRRLYEKTNK